jgi:hypothetical protein
MMVRQVADEKPKNIDEYKRWLQDKHGVEISAKDEVYYKLVTERIKSDFEGSDFWLRLKDNLHEYNDEYLLNTGYDLLREYKPTLLTKPFTSFLLKTYRKNVLLNKNLPKEPQGGWILPFNWYSKINDIVRTLIEVKYLDGVEFMIEKIKAFCEEKGDECLVFMEAREEGYYAAHLYIKRSFEVPRMTWDTEKLEVSVEIQLTTQLQEVIRRLLHSYYDNVRKRDREIKWQWNYKSEEFAANYLGHILHYVEGMIMEVRDSQRKKEKML